MEINPNEEQVAEPSSGEEKETSKEEQVTKPSDSRDRYEKFTEKKATEKAAKSKETSKEKEAPLEKETGEKEAEPEEPEAHLYLVGKDGKKHPFILNVDGELVKPDSVEKAITYGQLGFHGNRRLEELNAKEKELQAGADTLAKIMKAMEERASQSVPTKPSDEEEVEEEDEDEDLLDPDVSARFKALKKELKEVKGESKMVKQMLFKMMVTDEGSKIDGEIKELHGDSYSEKKRKKVYRLLAENDEKTGKPKYKSVKEAVEAEKKEREEDLKEYLDKNPEILEMKKKDREEAVAEYLEAKEKDEEAPVSPPSETPVDELASAPEKKKKKEGYGSIMAAAEAGMKSIAERRGIARKH